VTLAHIWYWILAASLATYVVLDGFDLGVGLIQPLIAKTPAERAQLSKSIGPVWDGNEVWLLASGGVLVFAYPKLYAVSISGFYLPVTILLWLLAFRALGLEMRHHHDHPLWEQLWSAAFSVSSGLVALFLSVALGNVLRGVSIDSHGEFFAPFWAGSPFEVGDETGILDLYTVTIGTFGTLAIALHGALWVAHRTEGPVTERAKALLRPLLIAVAAFGVIATLATSRVQPQAVSNAHTRPGGLLLPAVAIGALIAVLVFKRRKDYAAAFKASCAFLFAAALSAGFGIYPYVLPARVASRGLLADAAATSDYGLSMGFVWWIPGTVLVALYFRHMYRALPKVVASESRGAGH
jgi:cytochrome d ubiquinol oxidase subunit II